MFLANYFLISALTYSSRYFVMGCDVAISVLAILYLVFKVPEESKELPQREFTVTEMKNFKELDEKKGEESISQEPNQHFNYKFCQLALSCYCFYLGMVLTNWEWKVTTYALMVSRISQSGLLFLFYFWTLLAPVLFPDRDFHN